MARDPRRYGVVGVHPIRLCVSTRFLQIVAASAARTANLVAVAGSGRVPVDVVRDVVFAFEREAARALTARGGGSGGGGGGVSKKRHLLDTPVFFEAFHISAIDVCVRFVARGLGATPRGGVDVSGNKIVSALGVRARATRAGCVCARVRV